MFDSNMWALQNSEGEYLARGGFTSKPTWEDLLCFSAPDYADEYAQLFCEEVLHPVAVDMLKLPMSPCKAMPDDPDRYNHGSVTCIEAIRAALTPDEFRGFCKGSVLKYVWRERYKGGDGDLDKASDYLFFALEGEENDD